MVSLFSNSMDHCYRGISMCTHLNCMLPSKNLQLKYCHGSVSPLVKNRMRRGLSSSQRFEWGSKLTHPCWFLSSIRGWLAHSPTCFSLFVYILPSSSQALTLPCSKLTSHYSSFALQLPRFLKPLIGSTFLPPPVWFFDGLRSVQFNPYSPQNWPPVEFEMC